jgi:uncharacterized RDD family membrane protein YckC
MARSAAKPYPVDDVDASKRQRFFNMLLDHLGASALIGVVGASFARLVDGVGVSVFAYAILFFYYAGFEAALGRTPAKFVTGTKVVAIDGGRPSLAQILGRTLTRLIPFEPLSFLGRGSGWHDRWTRTRVVHTRIELDDEPLRSADWVADPRVAAGRVRVVVNPGGDHTGAKTGTYRDLDAATRRVVCGVCGDEFKYGRSSCPRCEAQYRYVAGRPELYDD